MTDIYDIPVADRICRAFAAMACRTWRDLADSPELEEGSITDYRLLMLKRLCPNEVHSVKFTRPREAQTGADWEWWFGSGHDWFGMRVQAKKLHPRTLEYTHLDYRLKRTNQLQVERLLEDARKQNLSALYCFYNYWKENAVQLPWRCGTFAPVTELWGCSVADAGQVRGRIDQGRKHISHLADISFPLNCLTCCRGHSRLSGTGTTLPFRARGVVVALRGSAEGVCELRNHPPPYVASVLQGDTFAEPPSEDLDGILVIQENPEVYADAYQDTTRLFGPTVVRYREPLPLRELLINSVGTRLTLIPTGQFLMGSAESDAAHFGDERPQHRVRITKPFYLGVYPVTQHEYESVMGTNPSYFRDDRQRPVENVSWFDAVQFCNRLSEREGREPYYAIDGTQVTMRGGDGYRLPTEAEWEYACRAGTTTEYCFGDDDDLLEEYAWFGKNSGRQTQPVGAKKPNPWGLHDVHGNVWEWCEDWYASGYYAHSPTDDPRGPESGSLRVCRGGCWRGVASVCRASYRWGDDPGNRLVFLGFRLARAVS